MLGRHTENDGRGFVSRGRVGFIAVLALAAGLAAPGAARAGELFEAATAEEIAVARRAAPAAAGSGWQQVVRLNRAELAAHMAPLGMDRAPGRVKRALLLDGEIGMTLTPGLAVALQRSSVDRVPGGGYLWSADVAGGDGGTGSFLIEDGQMLGRVQAGGMVYMIEPVDDALHRITEVDPAEIPGDIVVPAPAPPAPAPAVTMAKAKGKTTVTFLVAYTKKAKNASPNIVQEIKFATAWANRAFKNSGAKVEFKLVKTMLARNYDEDSTDYDGNLDDLAFGPPLAKVRKQRNKKKADLVSLIREGGKYCGTAFFDETPTNATAGNGFSVTSRGVCIPVTFAHEAGHNMGLDHDRFVTLPAPKSKYNFGYVNLKAAIQTIMAYFDRCDAAGKACTEIQYFSTPKKKPNGKKIGQRQGKRGAADATRRLNETRGAIAAYR